MSDTPEVEQPGPTWVVTIEQIVERHDVAQPDPRHPEVVPEPKIVEQPVFQWRASRIEGNNETVMVSSADTQRRAEADARAYVQSQVAPPVPETEPSVVISFDAEGNEIV